MGYYRCTRCNIKGEEDLHIFGETGVLCSSCIRAEGGNPLDVEELDKYLEAFRRQLNTNTHNKE